MLDITKKIVHCRDMELAHFVGTNRVGYYVIQYKNDYYICDQDGFAKGINCPGIITKFSNIAYTPISSPEEAFGLIDREVKRADGQRFRICGINVYSNKKFSFVLQFPSELIQRSLHDPEQMLSFRFVDTNEVVGELQSD